MSHLPYEKDVILNLNLSIIVQSVGGGQIVFCKPTRFVSFCFLGADAHLRINYFYVRRRKKNKCDYKCD